jgi:hypothetical protein
MVAHGVSRGEPHVELASPGRGERKIPPGFFRRSAARVVIYFSHGLRRGLTSAATPWLKNWQNGRKRTVLTSGASRFHLPFFLTGAELR